MKMRLPFFKKAVPIILAMALLLPLTACGGAKEDPVTEFKIRNDRVGTEISFNLPGNEEDWYDPEAYNDKAYFDRHFSNNENPEVEKGFEEMEIAGYRAAMRFNDEDFRDEVVIELVKDKAEKRLILDMMTYIDSDNDADKADVKNKQKIIDMVTAIINSAQFPETAESDAD